MTTPIAKPWGVLGHDGSGWGRYATKQEVTDEADDWFIFCRLWPMIGSFFAMRDAPPEQRADPSFYPSMLILMSARCLTLEVSCVRMINSLCDAIEYLHRTRPPARRAGT